jgi:hypothetical protein
MFKSMLRPGITAGVIGAIVSILVSVLLILALFLPGQLGITLYCLSTPIGFLLSLGIGLLAAFFAQRQSQEKLTANKGAVAGMIAGVVSAIIGIVAVPITQQMPKWLSLQDKMIEVQLAPSRMMGLSGEQLETARAQIVAMQESGAANTTMLAGIGIGLVCGLVVGVALGAGGGALGTLIIKPKLRKLVCVKCQNAFELGTNAYVETKEGSPDLVDYCNWSDLPPDTVKQQRSVIDQMFASPAQMHDRQWQCSMCKTVQAY